MLQFAKESFPSFCSLHDFWAFHNLLYVSIIIFCSGCLKFISLAYCISIHCLQPIYLSSELYQTETWALHKSFRQCQTGYNRCIKQFVSKVFFCSFCNQSLYRKCRNPSLPLHQEGIGVRASINAIKLSIFFEVTSFLILCSFNYYKPLTLFRVLGNFVLTVSAYFSLFLCGDKNLEWPTLPFCQAKILNSETKF